MCCRRELLKIRLISEWFVGLYKLYIRKRFKFLRIVCSGVFFYKVLKCVEYWRVWVCYEGEDFFGFIVVWVLWVVFGEEGEGSLNDLLRGCVRKVGCFLFVIIMYVSLMLVL